MEVDRELSGEGFCWHGEACTPRCAQVCVTCCRRRCEWEPCDCFSGSGQRGGGEKRQGVSGYSLRIAHCAGRQFNHGVCGEAGGETPPPHKTPGFLNAGLSIEINEGDGERQAAKVA